MAEPDVAGYCSFPLLRHRAPLFPLSGSRLGATRVLEGDLGRAAELFAFDPPSI